LGIVVELVDGQVHDTVMNSDTVLFLAASLTSLTRFLGW